jgi:hypothetical protein
MSYRPPLTTDPIDQQQPAIEVETSVSVSHEDLRAVVKMSDTSTKPGGPHLSQPGSVTNVPAKYT